jgi:hypothetical protein
MVAPSAVDRVPISGQPDGSPASQRRTASASARSIARRSAILARLAHANWPLFMEPEKKWYRTGGVETRVHQFLVQDPDGYLIRFSARIGQRPVTI